MTLREIRKHLPHGAMQRIAKEAGYTRSFVSRYFLELEKDVKGKILPIAKQIIIEEKELKEKMEQIKKEIAEIV